MGGSRRKKEKEKKKKPHRGEKRGYAYIREVRQETNENNA